PCAFRTACGADELAGSAGPLWAALAALGGVTAATAVGKMAEAAAAVPQHRFFCHSCKGEVSPKLPEYTCPRCESGFIEEVTDDSRYLRIQGYSMSRHVETHCIK
ncbi:hypothetical protein Nmel_005010, partial [Mimus melanotis]